MTGPPPKKTATARLADYYGPDMLHVIEDRPTLWFESDAAFDQLFVSLAAEHEPVMPMEKLLVKDLADCQWEITRLRRMKRASGAVEMPAAAWRLMGDSFRRNAPKLGVSADLESLSQIVRQTARGDKKAQERLEIIMEDADVSHDMLLYKTTATGLKTLNAIETALARKERERNTLLGRLEERRKIAAAQSKDFYSALPVHKSGVAGSGGKSGDGDDGST